MRTRSPRLSFTAYLGVLQHELGGSTEIIVDFCGLENIVIWCYRIAGEYGLQQTKRRRQRKLDAIVNYRIYPKTIASEYFCTTKVLDWCITDGSRLRYFYQDPVVPRTDPTPYYAFNQLSRICIILFLFLIKFPVYFLITNIISGVFPVITIHGIISGIPGCWKPWVWRLSSFLRINQ